MYFFDLRSFTILLSVQECFPYPGYKPFPAEDALPDYLFFDINTSCKITGNPLPVPLPAGAVVSAILTENSCILHKIQALL